MATTRLSLLRPLPHSRSSPLLFLRRGIALASSASAAKASDPTKNKKKERTSRTARSFPLEEHLKKRTRSLTEFDRGLYNKYTDDGASAGGHVPVMLGEALQVFRHSRLRSFVDCTLGAAGHSSAIVQMHGELQLYVGLDIDPVAHEKGRARIEGLLKDSEGLIAYTHLRNFKYIKSVIGGIDENLLSQGVDGILMYLGLSSMHVLLFRCLVCVLHANCLMNCFTGFELDKSTILREDSVFLVMGCSIVACLP